MFAGRESLRLAALALVILSACQSGEPASGRPAAVAQPMRAERADTHTSPMPAPASTPAPALTPAPSVADEFAPPVRLATLEETAVAESSGLVASRLNANLFWTHNDSGDAPFIYAFDRQGRRRGVWRVEGAQARDWEDIAAATLEGTSYLYLGDIGDNRERRATITVYRLREPSVASPETSKEASPSARPRLTEPAEAYNLRYPDGSHNAETLLVHPSSGDLYIITKTPISAAVVYKAATPLDSSRVTTLTRVGELRLPALLGGLLTGGDISSDGRRVALCDYIAGYELRLPDDAASFDAIWKQKPVSVNLGQRQQGEAVCYSLDALSLFATSEGRPAALFEVRRRDK